MALTCSICEQVPEDPVLSPVSNHVFERRLIIKYIEENGTDPINGEPLAEEQLLAIKTSPLVKPRPQTATSIPAILKLLQDEWDACMLHSFTLRQQLQTARQELSHALYQHDAACRVIARLTKEVNVTREALATLKPQAVQYGQVDAGAMQENMDVETTTLEMTDAVIQKLKDTAAMLTAERKKRGKKIPEGLLTPDGITAYQQASSHPSLHSASAPGILALDISSDDQYIITGGADENAVVFRIDTERIVATLKGHTKKVTGVIYHPKANIGITSSPDATVRIWNIENSTCGQVIRAHEGPVTGISLHPTGDYVLSSSTDEHWAFSDLQTGRVLSKAIDPESSSALTCGQFHPDGLIFGTGTANSLVKIWDLKERSNVANFQGHAGPVTGIAFSENGYYLATVANDSQVKLWDLRKLKNFRTISLDEHYEARSICFDVSGTYLAVSGTDIQIYLCKQWDLLKTLTDHSAVVTGVKFGQNATFLASCSMDRTVAFYRPPL